MIKLKMHYYVVKIGNQYYQQFCVPEWTPHLEKATRFYKPNHTKLLHFPVTRDMIKEIKLTEGDI